MKLNIRSFAITTGIIWGFLIFVTTWWLIARGLLVNEPTFIGQIYPFFTISPFGSLLGLIYGFIDGLILGAIFSWLYNLLTMTFISKINE